MSSNPIAFISALPQELKSLRDQLVSEVTYHQPPVSALSGKLNNQNIVLISSGIGSHAAVRGGEIALKNFNPKLIINIGYAGGAHPDVVAGDIIIPDKIYSPAGNPIPISEDLRKIAVKVANGINHKEAGLATVPNVIDKPTDKAMWGTKFGAHAIDMETYHLAKYCKKNNIPFLSIRVILDSLSFKLPNIPVVRNDGSIKWVSIAKLMVKEPFSLLKIAHRQSIADKSLKSFLNRWIELNPEIKSSKKKS